MLGDTIVALASAAGSSARAVLRLSGPAARAAAGLVFAPPLPAARAVQQGQIQVRGQSVAALALCFAAPASFTGEEVVELHVPGSPLLVQCLLEDLLGRGAGLGLRQALPGEFTARAYQNGKLSALAVEGLLGLLHAQDARAAAQAIPWLAGGRGTAVAELRAGMQAVLAEIEAGLDFTEDETGTAPPATLARDLEGLRTACAQLQDAVPRAVPGGGVLLLGASNIGKSALANALAERRAALVADQPGTTRDVVAIPLDGGAMLWDGPGDLAAATGIDAAALALRDRLAAGAASLLLVLDAAAPVVPAYQNLHAPVLAVVWSRVDRVPVLPPLPAELAQSLPPDTPVLATSANQGLGIAALRDLLRRQAVPGGSQVGAPLRTAFAAVREQLELAQASLGPTPELAAAAVQAGLRFLEEVDGQRHSPEQVLGRIYARFCLGK